MDSKEEKISTTEEAFAQAQIPVKYNLPVSVTLRHQLDIVKSCDGCLSTHDCIKIGNKLVFTDPNSDRLIVCNADGTGIYHIPLSYSPWYITDVDSNTVAVSCPQNRIILILNISTAAVINEIQTKSYSGISYEDNHLYAVTDGKILDVMDLAGNIVRTIHLPSNSAVDITVDRQRLIYVDRTSICCCDLEGKQIWKFGNEKYQNLRGVTTDDEGNVYSIDNFNNAVVVVSDDCKFYRGITAESEGVNMPNGVHFDKNENILLVCNYHSGKGFLFDVKKNLK